MISQSRSFLWNSEPKHFVVRSTFQELGLLFIYSVLLLSLTGNWCCVCSNEYRLTEGEFNLPLCSHYVGTYNGLNLQPINNRYKGYERYLHTFQAYHSLYHLRHECDCIKNSDSDFDVLSSTTDSDSDNIDDTIINEESSTNDSIPGLLNRNDESDTDSEYDDNASSCPIIFFELFDVTKYE